MKVPQVKQKQQERKEIVSAWQYATNGCALIEYKKGNFPDFCYYLKLKMEPHFSITNISSKEYIGYLIFHEF